MNKREPLLSEEMARNIMKNCAYNPGTMNPVSETRAFYESLIDSGKLRVEMEVECVSEGRHEVWCEWLRCPCTETTPIGSNYYPGCGAKITER